MYWNIHYWDDNPQDVHKARALVIQNVKTVYSLLRCFPFFPYRLIKKGA